MSQGEKQLFARVFCLGGLALLAVGVNTWYSASHLLTHGRKAEGTIAYSSAGELALHFHADSSTIVVPLEGSDFEDYGWGSGYPVLYDPQYPTAARRPRQMETNRWAGLCLAGVGCFFAATGLVLWRGSRSGAQRSAEPLKRSPSQEKKTP